MKPTYEELEQRVQELEEAYKLTRKLHMIDIDERDKNARDINALRAAVSGDLLYWLSRIRIHGRHEKQLQKAIDRVNALLNEPANEGGPGPSGDALPEKKTPDAALVGTEVEYKDAAWHTRFELDANTDGLLLLDGELLSICQHYEQTHDVKEGLHRVRRCYGYAHQTDVMKCDTCNGHGHTLEPVEQEGDENV